MKRLLIILSLLLSPVIVIAAQPEEVGNITQLFVHRNPDNNLPISERFIVRLDSTISNGNNCGIDQWTGYLDSEAGKAQYSTLMALSMVGKPVKLQGTSADHCVGGVMLIRNVYLNW